MTTSYEVLTSRFRPTRLRTGYVVDVVDDFLDRCCATLTHYEEGGQASTVLLTKGSGTSPLLSAADVRDARLRTTKWREGYVMEEVDDLVDEIVNELVRWETVAR